jgi:hypothetical protein
MLFYDEAEADRMFAEAGYESFEHVVQQARPGSPRAITTVAHLPPEPDGTGSSQSADESRSTQDTDGSGSSQGTDDPASGVA